MFSRLGIDPEVVFATLRVEGLSDISANMKELMQNNAGRRSSSPGSQFVALKNDDNWLFFLISQELLNVAISGKRR